jgi:hypothetical protein
VGLAIGRARGEGVDGDVLVPIVLEEQEAIAEVVVQQDGSADVMRRREVVRMVLFEVSDIGAEMEFERVFHDLPVGFVIVVRYVADHVSPFGFWRFALFAEYPDASLIHKRLLPTWSICIHGARASVGAWPPLPLFAHRSEVGELKKPARGGPSSASAIY